jgi:hypothetical protein
MRQARTSAFVVGRLLEPWFGAGIGGPARRTPSGIAQFRTSRMGFGLVAFASAGHRAHAGTHPAGYICQQGERQDQSCNQREAASPEGKARADWVIRAHEAIVRPIALKNRWSGRLNFFVTRVIGLRREVSEDRGESRSGLEPSSKLDFDDQNGAPDCGRQNYKLLQISCLRSLLEP